LEKQKFEKKLINTTKNHKPTSFSIDKYPALKTISKIYEIFAWIIVLITLIITIFSLKDSFLLGLGKYTYRPQMSMVFFPDFIGKVQQFI